MAPVTAPFCCDSIPWREATEQDSSADEALIGSEPRSTQPDRFGPAVMTSSGADAQRYNAEPSSKARWPAAEPVPAELIPFPGSRTPSR